MTGKRARRDVKAKDVEIKAVAADLDGLLGELATVTAEIAETLTRPKQPPDNNVRVISSD